jgi:hypothetical protein
MMVFVDEAMASEFVKHHSSGGRGNLGNLDAEWKLTQMCSKEDAFEVHNTPSTCSLNTSAGQFGP